jgi:hypothetical protein
MKRARFETGRPTAYAVALRVVTILGVAFGAIASARVV